MTLQKRRRINFPSALKGMVQVIKPAALQNFQDLPAKHQETLSAFAKRIQKETAARKIPGVTILIPGAGDRGKTMAAEFLSSRLNLDLYRVDLGAIVNKYIGETEKNLDKILSAADDLDVILLFDEADSLFGKRSKIKDSHDRYANAEISYLLSRLERYNGLAILATNHVEASDEDFQKRFDFVVDFYGKQKKSGVREKLRRRGK